MITILQWTTFAVCAVVAIARIPSALRGENRSISILCLALGLAFVWISSLMPKRALRASFAVQGSG
jgi:hypothetical protein